jgi:hypothetical protein
MSWNFWEILSQCLNPGIYTVEFLGLLVLLEFPDLLEKKLLVDKLLDLFLLELLES